MEEKKNKDIIDLRELWKKVKERKRLFLITLPVTFVLSCLYIICFPRYYDTDVKLAPEMENSMSGGTLGSLAASFGFDLSNMESSDAISPMLYPDLMEDNGFVSKFFDFKVVSADGTINTNYHEYLQKLQKHPWWDSVIDWIKTLLPKKEEQLVTGAGGDGQYNPYILSRRENSLIKKIQDNVQFSMDKKTGVITINVRDQDKLICKTVADSVCSLLQQFITDYRTNKARNDLKYYTKLASDAKHDYERARQLYGSYSDRNMDVVLESYRAKQEDLENDMQLKFNTYTAMQTQLQQAKAKVQERTPAFTLLKGASVPIRPTGPKRMIFVIGMVFLAFFATIAWILKDELKKTI
ncbi:MAG: chain-length determining protein [Prevotella sp.]|nr:chain-length determining protein [Prevotella sp.]